MCYSVPSALAGLVVAYSNVDQRFLSAEVHVEASCSHEAAVLSRPYSLLTPHQDTLGGPTAVFTPGHYSLAVM